VDTDSVALYFGDAEARRTFLEEVEGATPLRALGQPAEVAAAVAWLCSPDADWMQGQVLYLDGGVFLHAPGHSVRWWRQTGRLPPWRACRPRRAAVKVTACATGPSCRSSAATRRAWWRASPPTSPPATP